MPDLVEIGHWDSTLICGVGENIRVKPVIPNLNSTWYKVSAWLYKGKCYIHSSVSSLPDAEGLEAVFGMKFINC